MAGSGLRRPTLLDSTTTSNRSAKPARPTSLRSRRAQALVSGSVALSRRRNPSGKPLARSYRENASNGLLKTTPPKSKMTARTGMTEMRSARQQVAGDRLPQGGRQAQRLDVHALVVAVEHPAVVLEGQLLAEQAEPVGGGAQPAEEAGVGRPDADHGHQVAVGVEDPRGAGQGVPQRCLHR